MSDAVAEISRRRTFAIISHPDAGKTTLTENLLLAAGNMTTTDLIGNGVLALRLARQACQATGFRQPDCLDALAAAYAEMGRFDRDHRATYFTRWIPGSRQALGAPVPRAQPASHGNLSDRLFFPPPPALLRKRQRRSRRLLARRL